MQTAELVSKQPGKHSPLKRWLFAGPGIKIYASAHTCSEARGLVKRHLKLDRLPTDEWMFIVANPRQVESVDET